MAPVLSNSKFQSLRSVSEFKRWFSRPYLGYGYSIYDQAYNISFHQKYESIEYNDINNRSCWRLLYHELGFEFLESGRYNWNLCCLCKVSILSHLDRFIWQCSYSQRDCTARNDEKLPHIKARQIFQNYFFLFDCDRIE